MAKVDKKAEKKAEKNISKEEVPCGCCEKPCPKQSDLLCSGCNKYICERDTCGASVWGKGHPAWMHKPCDACGEPVDDPDAAKCSNCE